MKKIEEIKDITIYFPSWKIMYNIIKENYKRQQKDIPEEFDWVFQKEVASNRRSITMETVYLRINHDYLKARLWDEVQDLPYQMDDEELANIAYSFATGLLRDYGPSVMRLADWLEKVALSERERIWKEEHKYGHA